MLKEAYEMVSSSIHAFFANVWVFVCMGVQ